VRNARILGFTPQQQNTTGDLTIDVAAANAASDSVIELGGVDLPTVVNADGSLTATVAATGDGFLIAAPLQLTTTAQNAASAPAGTISLFTVASTVGLQAGMTVRFGDTGEEA